MGEWIGAHKGLFVAVSVLTFVGTLVLMPILVIRIPADYFVHPRRESAFAESHPVVRIGFLVVKNGLGVLLLLAGIVMTLPFVFGQGVLTMLIGISLLDLPGKRRLEVAIVRREPVHKSLNWIRRKAGRPPLQVPPKSEPHA